MTIVSFIAFAGCPHAAAMRQAIEAICAARPDLQLQIHDHADPDFPDHLKWWGSPTILVDGKDLFGGSIADHQACRHYPSGPPDAATITAALERLLDSP